MRARRFASDISRIAIEGVGERSVRQGGRSIGRRNRPIGRIVRDLPTARTVIGLMITRDFAVLDGKTDQLGRETALPLRRLGDGTVDPGDLDHHPVARIGRHGDVRDVERHHRPSSPDPDVDEGRRRGLGSTDDAQRQYMVDVPVAGRQPGVTGVNKVNIRPGLGISESPGSTVGQLEVDTVAGDPGTIGRSPRSLPREQRLIIAREEFGHERPRGQRGQSPERNPGASSSPAGRDKEAQRQDHGQTQRMLRGDDGPFIAAETHDERSYRRFGDDGWRHTETRALKAARAR